MKLFLPRNGATTQNDDFLQVMHKIFSAARYIGISSKYDKFFIWTVAVFILLVSIEVAAIWKIIKLLTGIARNPAVGFVARFSGTVFYGNALLSLIFSIRFITSWTNLSYHWYKADSHTGFRLPPDLRIRRRVITISSFVAICAFVEHGLSMMSATGLDCPPEEYFRLYILTSHGFLIQSYEYTTWIAIPVFILSKVATVLWNFQDLIIILISMGLTSRYHRLNFFVKQVVRREKKNKDIEKTDWWNVAADRDRWKSLGETFGQQWDDFGTDAYLQVQTWRKVREAYVRQAALVRQVDRALGPLTLLSNVNNLYFICLQLFLGIGKLSGTFIHRTYYFVSLSWLLFRACSVVLAASDIYAHSSMALSSLYKCPGSSYNVEIKRLINQLTHDDVALTGMSFFSLNRRLLLQVAAVILKYELVLIQYDKN